MRIHPAFAASLIAALSLQELVGAQTPSGRKIQAKNGDVILVENADRVGLVRRKEAQVRAIYNPLQRWLVLLVDYAPPGVDPDGQVDASYRYLDVAGEWPLGERWEGRAVIDDYSMAGEGSPCGIGLSSAMGLIQVLGPPGSSPFKDASAVATLSFRGSGRAGRASSFDLTEQQEVATVSAGIRASTPAAPAAGAQQPIRVGGNIRPPTKTHDVRPVYPDEALQARITGVVILEAIIGVDGSVTDAKVLQSIPILDAAAVDAVKQWRFEPTHLNGVPVPVIMTVTVSFNLK
jgi:TonB family protein